MSTAQLLKHLRQLTDVERLEVIEVATRLIRKNLSASPADAAIGQDRRMQAAAAGVKGLYEANSEFTEWTELDAEEFTDEHFER